MVNIVFKTKANDKGPKKELTPKVSLAFFANYFNWFVLLVCVIILFSGYWWLIKPKYNVIIRDELIKKEEKIYDDKMTYLQQLDEVKDLYKKISDSDKNKIDTILSAGQDIDTVKINLLKEITYLGKINNAIVEKLDITPLDNSEGKFIDLVKNPRLNFKNENLQIMIVSFKLNGVDYESLKRIVGRFEKNLRLMDITKLEFDPANQTATIELNVYYLKT
ncbi:MAG TPA: hypothetical protein PK720_04085 [bacterium]|jgi:hypothetical protein|nr:hypothetical protein [bacterium]